MMTTTKKNIIEGHQNIKKLIRRCMLSKDASERLLCGKLLLKSLEENKVSALKCAEMFDDLVNKLITASKTIRMQNEWLDCLYTAMGDKKEETIYAAYTAKTVLENYKKKNQNREE